MLRPGATLAPRRARHPLHTAFRTVDAADYCEIATVDVDRRAVLDLCARPPICLSLDTLLRLQLQTSHKASATVRCPVRKCFADTRAAVAQRARHEPDAELTDVLHRGRALDTAAGLAAVVTVDAGDGHTSSARIYEIGRGRAQVAQQVVAASL